MGNLILLTGGTRSGKSAYAERLLADSAHVLYIATARCLDEEMAERVRRHRAARPVHWATVEASRGLDRVLMAHPESDVLFDCVGNMVTNLMLDEEPDFDHLSHERIEEIEALIGREFSLLLDALRARSGTAVLVTNEVGGGLVSPYRMGRVFVDYMGRLNQRLAAAADQVYLLTCGLPFPLKSIGKDCIL